MVGFLFWGSCYLVAVTALLLFLSCSGYSEDPEIREYRNAITDFYDSLFCKLKSNKIKFLCIAYSDGVLGAYYRHLMCKEYLLNEEKLRDLGFVERDILHIQEKIIPGYMKRADIFDILHVMYIGIAINFGVIVGKLI